MTRTKGSRTRVALTIAVLIAFLSTVCVTVGPGNSAPTAMEPVSPLAAVHPTPSGTIHPAGSPPTINYHAISNAGNTIAVAHVNNIATKAGDSLWVFISQQNAGGSTQYIKHVSDNKSEVYTLQLNYSNKADSLTIWSVSNIPVGASYRSLQLAVTPTVTHPSNLTIAVIDLTNVPSSPVDAVGTVNTGTGTSCSSSVTTTVANDMVLMGLSANANPTTAATGGDTRQDSGSAGNQETGATFYESDSGTGALTMSCTLGTSHTWASGSVAVKGSVVPPAPTGLSVTGHTTSSVSLSWTQAAGGGIVNNTIYSSLTGTGAWTGHSTSGAAVSGTVSGLACNTLYYFEVSASNASGTGPKSNPAVSQMTSGGGGCTVYVCNLASITTTLVYRNETVVQQCGNVTVTTGALLIDNVTWQVQENNSKHVTNVAENHYLQLTSSGHLTIKESTFESAAGAAYPTFIAVTAGTFVANHDHFLYLGKVSPVTHGQGIYVQTGSVLMKHDVFAQVHQILFTTSGANFDGVANSYFASNQSYSDNGQGAIMCSSGCAHLKVTNDTIDTSRANMISIDTTGLHSDIYGNTITANVTGTASYRGVVALASGIYASQGLSVSHNAIEGGNVYVKLSGANPSTTYSWYNITYNTIDHSGQGAGSGVCAILLTATNEGGGSGNHNLWMSHVLVSHNTITNDTRDAIRLDANITLFNVSYNSITHPDGTGTADANETTSIYIIRNVNNGTVFHNTEILFGTVWIYTHSICVGLESRVRYVNVSDNSCQNWTTGGFYNQGNTGADSAPKWLRGANLYNVFYKNRAVEFRSIAASMDSTVQQDCYEDWSWANHTTFKDNICTYVAGGWNSGTYYGAGLRVSSYANTFIGNVITNARYGVVIHRFSTSFENYPTYYLNQSGNVFDNNTFTNIRHTVFVSDNSQHWPSSTNILEGVVPATWNYTFVTGSDILWLGLGTKTYNVNYLNTSGTIDTTSNFHFHGTGILGQTGVTYTLPLGQYNLTRAKVNYAGLQVNALATGGGTMTVHITNWHSSGGAVNLTASLTSSRAIYFNDSSATTGKLYDFKVNSVITSTSTASAGKVSFVLSFVGSDTLAIVEDTGGGGVPKAPTSAVASLVTVSGFTLSWTNPPGTLTNLTVYWGVVPGCSSPAFSLSAGIVTTHAVTGLTGATAYNTLARAWNSTGEGPPSNCVAVTTLPGAPTSLTATAISGTRIDLSWVNPTGTLVDDHVLVFSGGSCSVGGAPIDIGHPGTSQSVTGLSSGNTYSFEAVAYSAGGAGAASSCAAATTQSVPTAPTGVTISLVAVTSFTVSWTPPHGTVVNYTLYWGTTAACAGTRSKASVGVTTSHGVSGLPGATEEYVNVRAWNSTGAGALSSCVPATTLPAAPTGLTAAAVSIHEIDLAWTNPSGTITDDHVLVFSGTTCSIGGAPVDIGHPATSDHFTGLVAGTTYSFEITAYSSSGAGAASNCAFATTIAAAPVAPTLLNATAISSSQINLSWTNPAGSLVGGFILEYAGGTCAGPPANISLGGVATAHTIAGLNSSTLYSFKVGAATTGGSGPPSTCANATTLAYVPPPVPTGIIGFLVPVAIVLIIAAVIIGAARSRSR